MAEDITWLLSKMIRACNGLGIIGPEGPPIVVGTGSAVSPIILCLSAQGYGKTDPTIMPPLTV